MQKPKSGSKNVLSLFEISKNLLRHQRRVYVNIHVAEWQGLACRVSPTDACLSFNLFSDFQTLELLFLSFLFKKSFLTLIVVKLSFPPKQNLQYIAVRQCSCPLACCTTATDFLFLPVLCLPGTILFLYLSRMHKCDYNCNSRCLQEWKSRRTRTRNVKVYHENTSWWHAYSSCYILGCRIINNTCFLFVVSMLCYFLDHVTLGVLKA